MKKSILLLALATAAVVCVAACDSPAPAAGSSQTASAMPLEVPDLALTVEVVQEDSVVQIPEFVTQDNNPAVNTLNAKIKENHLKLYEEWKNHPDGIRQLEIKTYSVKTEPYVQAVVTQLEFPTYGTQGDVFSYNYDIKQEKVLTLDDALAQFNTTREEVLAIPVWNLPNGTTVERAELQGFLIQNGKLDCYAKVFFTSPNSELYSMIYTIHVSDKTTQAYDGQTLLTPEAPPEETSSQASLPSSDVQP